MILQVEICNEIPIERNSYDVLAIDANPRSWQHCWHIGAIKLFLAYQKTENHQCEYCNKISKFGIGRYPSYGTSLMVQQRFQIGEFIPDVGSAFY